MSNIAIIIPAYKHNYLEETLESIAIQDLTDCHIYIGDDASPYPIADIVKKYENRIPLTYTRYEDNLGGKDLVAQWNRCLKLANDEQWIWLFSDDDIMCEGCVASVCQFLFEKQSMADVFHINGDVVDNEYKVINWRGIKYFPYYLTTAQYIESIINGADNTWGVNFIVRKEKIIDEGGFENFDMAWNSDRASWIKFSFPKGIITIPDARILWRYSGENITSERLDKVVLLRKAEARVNFLKWLYSFSIRNKIKIHKNLIGRLWYLLRCLKGDCSLGVLKSLSVFVKSLIVFKV